MFAIGQKCNLYNLYEINLKKKNVEPARTNLNLGNQVRRFNRIRVGIIYDIIIHTYVYSVDVRARAKKYKVYLLS